MKKLYTTFLLILIAIFQIISQTNPNHVWVKGYTKSNGTYVQGYYRTAPNHTNVDNFSTRGNTNPYNGKAGWITPDNHTNPWKDEKKDETLYEVTPYSYSTNNSFTLNSSKSITATQNFNNSVKTFSQNDWYSKGNQVNVRYESNTTSNIAFRINKGDRIQVLGKSTNKDYIQGLGEDYWYEIKCGKVTGWVFGKLIGKQEHNTTHPANWDGEFLTITGNNVNVRSEPSITIGKVKFQLNKNDAVEVIAKTKDKYYVEGYGSDFWYYIRKEMDQGWVFGKLTAF